MWKVYLIEYILDKNWMSRGIWCCLSRFSHRKILPLISEMEQQRQASFGCFKILYNNLNFLSAFDFVIGPPLSINLHDCTNTYFTLICNASTRTNCLQLNDRLLISYAIIGAFELVLGKACCNKMRNLQPLLQDILILLW